MAANQEGQGSEGGLALDPMHQFEIERLLPIKFGGLDASFTNSSLWMVLGVFLVSLLLLAGSKKIVPGRLQSVGEILFEFISNMVRDTMGEEGRKFFPFIFTLFMFVLISNLLGMVPYSFTVTSHIIVTFALALTVWLGATIYGFYKNGLGYLKLFAPPGTPMAMLPILVPIEIISYFTRPISLSVRLFANMMAGHTMLKVFGAFVAALGWAGIVPLVVMVGFTGLEILVAFLQAFIFAILSCMYINDALHPQH
ncbi:ATP synthase subunit a [bacterium MnTg02]|nr:ATP synthase subunit a [bacterium MnTg02]